MCLRRFSCFLKRKSISGALQESKWFEKINFIVTQFTSYFNDRSYNFTHKECELHFYPPESASVTKINYASALTAVELIDFRALLYICSFLLVISLLILFVEILVSNYFHRKISLNNVSFISMPQIIYFSYKLRCVNPKNAIKKFNHTQRCIINVNGIAIESSEVKVNICELFEISFSLVLKLNEADTEQIIDKELKDFLFYLDSISIC
jgi:hypothetical protein